jgi:hypothetical protein
MLTAVLQKAKPEVLAFDFAPTQDGLTLSWPAWTLQVQGVEYAIPEGAVDLGTDTVDRLVRLWLSPDPADGHLWLDVCPLDGFHRPAVPGAWQPIGCVCVLWGEVAAGATDADFEYLLLEG